MTRYARCAVLVTVIFVGCLCPLYVSAEEERFRGETTVNVIEVPVRVIDLETGEPVMGLTAADFEVYENDRSRSVSNFAELWRSEDDAVAVSGRDQRDVTGDEALRTRSVEMVYLVDLFLMNKEGRNRAVEGLRKSYSEGVPDGQYVSLVVYDGGLETLVDRSDDREEILDGLEELGYITARGNQQTISMSSELISDQVSGERDQAFYERRQRHREFIGELEKKVRRVGDAAVSTMSRYAGADGRRALVLFTPGHPRTNWSPEYAAVDYVNVAAEYPVDDLWREVALDAADMGFTIFVVDTSGIRANFASDVETGVTDSLETAFDKGTMSRFADDPVYETPTGGDTSFAIDPDGQTHDLGSWLERTRKQLMISATTATGGEALFIRDVEPAMERVNSEMAHHYSVAYTAEHSGDGKTYAIEVTLPAYPDYRIIHRTGYVDQPAAVRSANRLRSAMLFGADANPLGVRVETGESEGRFRLGAAGSKRVQVPIHVKIPYGRLEMIPRGDVYWSTVWITLFAEDATGNQSALASHEQPITVASERYQEAKAKGYFSYHTGVEIEGGEQRLFIGIEEELSGRTSIMPLEFDH